MIANHRKGGGVLKGQSVKIAEASAACPRFASPPARNDKVLLVQKMKNVVKKAFWDSPLRFVGGYGCLCMHCNGFVPKCDLGNLLGQRPGIHVEMLDQKPEHYSEDYELM